MLIQADLYPKKAPSLSINPVGSICKGEFIYRQTDLEDRSLGPRSALSTRDTSINLVIAVLEETSKGDISSFTVIDYARD